MNLSQFITALDRYGSALDRWPPAEGEAAHRLLASSPEAAAELAEAARVEHFIRSNDPAAAIGPDAVVRLTNMVLARLPAQPNRTVPRWESLLRRLGLHGARLVWAPRFAMSMALAALLGLAAGDRLTSVNAQQVSPTELLSMSNSYLPLDLR